MRLEGVRLAAHYFRQEPRMAVRALMVSPAAGLLICSWRGHRQGNVTRLLGLCDHCMATLP